VLFFTRFKESKKLIRKIYLLIEGSLNWLYGELNYKRFDHVFAIADSELNYLTKKCQKVSTQKLVYPLKKVKEKKHKMYDLLFVGYLEWPPNEVAIRWLVKKIMPLVWEKLPQVKLHIVDMIIPNSMT
jgi:hypothetical protein